MYKNATYKEKFVDLQEWIPTIIDSIKKDLKNDHLKKDLYFVKKFLPSKNIQKVTVEELTQAYSKAIQEEEKGEEIAEFLVSRWLLKNTEMYHLFEKCLSQITSNFTELEELTHAQAQSIVESSTAQFGAVQTYLFAVLNSVVFPNETFEQLKNQAKEDREKEDDHLLSEQEQSSHDSLQRTHEREVARITDKYEKKLAGMQKKYQIDVDHLKKQISILQRKLQEKSA
ncbi:MAG: hypothetical protein ACHQUC_03265 [Chlamydiales bacterium]